MTHQKVLVTLIICIGIICSVFVISRTGNSQTNTEKDASTQQNIDLLATIDKTSDADTDEDGLKDWEESLIGTNPQSKDTDADGTTDGDEVTQNRDPRKKGPNDKTVAQNIVVEASITDETLTDRVSRDFFSRYLIAKQQNKDITPEEASLIAQQVVANIPAFIETKVYGTKDISITSNDSEQTRLTYAKQISDILVNNSPQFTENSLEIVGRIIQNPIESDRKKLATILASYKTILSKTLAIPVPSRVVPEHLVYINALSSIYSNLAEIEQLSNDPIRGYVAYSHYSNFLIKISIAFENLKKASGV
jgi:hypothetical protein